MNISHTDHPYYPPSAVIHGFVPKALSTFTILAIFATTSTAVLYPTFLAIRRIRPTLPKTEVAAALWFVLCGCIHLGLEGKEGHLFLRI